MTFSLNQIKKTRSDIPPRITVYGGFKIGKSTFATCAPRPIVIQTEDGLENIDADAFPLCRSWNDVMSAVSSLYQEKHDFKTVVLDSVDWSERLLHAHVSAEKCDGKGIESPGYGKGYTYAAEYFGELLDGLNALRLERGMTVIAVCHAQVQKFDDPMSSSYDRWSLKLHKQTAKLLQEWSDVIGFAQVDTATKIEKKDDFKKSERHRAITTGRRVLHLTGTPAFDAGNRYSLPDVIDLSWASFADALSTARNQQASK